MKHQHSTKIADRSIPIRSGDVITLRFTSGAHGEKEAGDYEFWTIFNNEYSFPARQRAGEDPGERFRRMEDDSIYEDHWKVASTAIGIRPATGDEVDSWLDGHQDDAKFVEIKKG